jgi:phospholipase/carboxylesterase
MAKRVHELIEHEMRVSKLPAHRILLAGFGEGGALALHAALTFPQRLAGAVSLAGYLPLPHLYPECISPAARGTDAAGSKKPLPVLCVHGNSDFVVPLSFASARYALLRQAGLSVELRTEWSMGHFLSNSSLMATQGWMTDALNKAQQEEEQQQQQQQVQQQQQQQQQQPL